MQFEAAVQVDAELVEHVRADHGPATAWAVAGISVLVTSGGAAAIVPEAKVGADAMTQGVDLLLILYMLKLLPAASAVA